MRIALTGTPGTGKTTVSERLAEELGFEVIHMGKVVRREGLYTEVDEERDSVITDIEAVKERFEEEDDVVIEDHLSHQLNVDYIIVLRCDPEVLESRLNERGYSNEKIHENAESEALDVILGEVIHGNSTPVYEIDTTQKTVEETVEELVEAINEGRERTNVVDWFDYLETSVTDQEGGGDSLTTEKNGGDKTRESTTEKNGTDRSHGLDGDNQE